MLPRELQQAIREVRQRIGRAISGSGPDEVSARWLRERDAARNAGDTLARALLDICTGANLTNDARSSVLDAISRYTDSEQNFAIARDVERIRTNK